MIATEKLRGCLLSSRGSTELEKNPAIMPTPMRYVITYVATIPSVVKSFDLKNQNYVYRICSVW